MPRFRITVEQIPAGSAAPDPDSSPLIFQAENHDDIIAIARRMNGRFDLDAADSQAFAIGLKLFAEIILKNRQREPFSLIRPALADFMKAVKGGLPASPTSTEPTQK